MTFGTPTDGRSKLNDIANNTKVKTSIIIIAVRTALKLKHTHFVRIFKLQG